MNKESEQKPLQHITLDQIINLHSYLSKIRDPTSKVKSAIEHLETIICHFALGLQQGPKS